MLLEHSQSCLAISLYIRAVINLWADANISVAVEGLLGCLSFNVSFIDLLSLIPRPLVLV